MSNSVQTKYFANANERKADGTEQLILKSLAFYWTDRDNVRINRLGEFTADCTIQSLCAIETDDIIIDDYLFQY